MSRSNHVMNLRAVDKMSAVLGRVAKQFGPINKAVKKANIEMKLYNRKTADMSARFNKVGKKFSKVGKSMTMGLTAPIAAFGALSMKTALDFEKGMNKVEALTGATGSTLAKMRDQAKDLGATTQFSAGQAADAMGFLGMAGWDTQQIMKGIPGVMSLAAASQIDLGRAADISSNIMGAFKIEAEQASRVADVLARTTSSSNVDMEMLAETMKYAAPVANKFGASLEDTATLAGILGNVGIQGSNAGTAIKNAMLGLAAPGGKARKLLETMGVEVADSSGKMRNFSNIIADMGGSLKQLPKADQMAVMKEVFGKLSLAGASELVDSITTIGKDGKTSFEILNKKINDTNKTAAGMAGTMNKGAVGAVKNLASAFESFQIALMESGILEILTKMMNKVTSLLRSFAQNKSLMKFVAIFGTIAAIMGPVLLLIGKLIAAFVWLNYNWGLITIAFQAGLAIIGAIGGALASPFVLAGAAIAGAIALIYKFRKELASIGSSAMGKVASFFGFGGGDSSKTAPQKPQALQNIQRNLTESKQVSESRLSIDLPKGVKTKTAGPMQGISLNTGMAGASF